MGVDDVGDVGRVEFEKLELTGICRIGRMEIKIRDLFFDYEFELILYILAIPVNKMFCFLG